MKLKRFNSTPWLLAVACVIAQFGNIGIDGKHVVVVEEEEQARKAKMGGGSSYYLRHQTNVSEEEADSSSFFGSLKLPSLKNKKWTRTLSNNGKKKKKSKKKKKNGTSQECGVDYCEAKQMNLGGLMTCLKSTFQHNSDVYFHGDEGYNMARITGWTISRLPAAVVYVEDVDGVKAALQCAVENGYKVSPRGGNHSFQGLATMDGYVVIDMGRTCKPDEFVINKDDQGPHILEGSKYIGTMKAQAGCSNVIMLAMSHMHFKEEAGMTLLGGCPSVGVTGYVLGGGAGDASPYLGYGVDVVKEFQIVLHDGTVVNASEEENPDLYWASRGGGGGNGIVTHLTFKVVQAPEQKYEEEQAGKKFTVLRITLVPKDLEKGAARIQEWFFDADPLLTGKFGGYVQWDGNFSPTSTAVYFGFLYLGSWKEAVEDLKATGLLDEDLFHFLTPSPPYLTGDTILTENHEVVCTSSSLPCPEFESIPGAMSTTIPTDQVGPVTRAFQFDTYAEAELFYMCVSVIYNPNAIFYSNWTGDFCKDLDIPDDKCEDVTPFPDTTPSFTARVPKSCIDRDVIDAMLNKAGDPSSFMNSHGPSAELVSRYFGNEVSVSDGLNQIMIGASDFNAVGQAGASMFQRFDDSFFAKVLNETSGYATHLQHGAALQVHPDDTAYPWRNTALMVYYDSSDTAADFIGRMVEGGYTPQGYYAYLNPFGMKKWKSYFFDTKWRKLGRIRAKYDPKDIFGKHLTIESMGEE